MPDLPESKWSPYKNTQKPREENWRYKGTTQHTQGIYELPPRPPPNDEEYIMFHFMPIRSSFSDPSLGSTGIIPIHATSTLEDLKQSIRMLFHTNRFDVGTKARTYGPGAQNLLEEELKIWVRWRAEGGDADGVGGGIPDLALGDEETEWRWALRVLRLRGWRDHLVVEGTLRGKGN